MAKHFYSYQFDMPYRPTYLRNWEVPKYYCPKPRRRIGTTKIISNSRGHLLPGVHRPPCNPFGDFIGTWEMPKKITRELANKMNGLADKKVFFEKCRVLASAPPKTKYQKETDEEKRKIKKEEDKRIQEEKDEKIKFDKEIARVEMRESQAEVEREVQILKTLILGEEERGQSQYQVMCFIYHFPKDAFISSDAMSKLRQKNPSTVRTPEEDLGRVNHTMDYIVILKHSGIISPFVRDLCAEAGLATYTRYEDIQKWSNSHSIPTTSYAPALKRFPTTPDYIQNEISYEAPTGLANCTNLKNMWTPCFCHLEQCIGWYPCELKYCKGKGSAKGPVSSYRCGIKTCKICHLFVYYIAQKQQCLWDE